MSVAVDQQEADLYRRAFRNAQPIRHENPFHTVHFVDWTSTQNGQITPSTEVNGRARHLELKNLFSPEVGAAGNAEIMRKRPVTLRVAHVLPVAKVRQDHLYDVFDALEMELSGARTFDSFRLHDCGTGYARDWGVEYTTSGVFGTGRLDKCSPPRVRRAIARGIARGWWPFPEEQPVYQWRGGKVMENPKAWHFISLALWGIENVLRLRALVNETMCDWKPWERQECWQLDKASAAAVEMCGRKHKLVCLATPLFFEVIS